MSSNDKPKDQINPEVVAKKIAHLERLLGKCPMTPGLRLEVDTIVRDLREEVKGHNPDNKKLSDWILQLTEIIAWIIRNWPF